MKVVVQFKSGLPNGVEETVIHAVQPGTWNTVHLTTPFLVSAGQKMVFTFGAEVQSGPEDFRSIVDILTDAIQHGRENPTHGTNCACMDGLLAEIRGQITGILPTFQVEPDWEKRIDARSRVAYLLRTATRTL